MQSLVEKNYNLSARSFHLITALSCCKKALIIGKELKITSNENSCNKEKTTKNVFVLNSNVLN